jgi:hypothetical protein
MMAAVFAPLAMPGAAAGWSPVIASHATARLVTLRPGRRRGAGEHHTR